MTRARWTAAALLACALVPLAGCGALPDNRPRVSIEFGVDPDLLENCPVLIDGKVVGRLTKTGQATRMSFPADMGKHEVRILSTRMECEPAIVTLEMQAQKVHLIAFIEERSGTDGSMRSVIALHG